MRDKLQLLMGLINIDINLPQNHTFVIAFWSNLIQLFDADDTRELAAVEFIIQNKPRDLIEVHHFLNMFCLQLSVTRVFSESRRELPHAAVQEYAKLVVKCTSAFGGAMVALSAYRNGVSVTKHTTNFQNNNLTQVNLGQPIDNKVDIKEVKKKVESVSLQASTKAIESKTTLNTTAQIKLKKNEKVST